MHHQYLTIGHSRAISKIAIEEARHDRHDSFRHTRYRYTVCRCGSACIPLVVARGSLLDEAAAKGPPNRAADGTGARHRRFGALVRIAECERTKKDWLKRSAWDSPARRNRRDGSSTLGGATPGKKGREHHHAGFEVPVADSGGWTLWQCRGTSSLRCFSFRAASQTAAAQHNGRNRCGGGSAGAPPFPTPEVAAGAATGGRRHPGDPDYKQRRGDPRWSGGRARPPQLRRAGRGFFRQRAPCFTPPRVPYGPPTR